MKRLMLISDNPQAAKFFDELSVEEFSVRSCLSSAEALKQDGPTFDLVFIELLLLKNFDSTTKTVEEFQELLAPLKQHFNQARFVILTEQRQMRECNNAIKGGADNYIPHPLRYDELTLVIETEYANLLKGQELKHLEERLDVSAQGLLRSSSSPVMQNVFEKIYAVAKTRTTILLTGASGTGKGALARMTHSQSERSNGPFISIHCGAIPENLIESELFGHEKGAFTGAIKRKLGKFELAHGGTLFLDEIGTITPAVQIKLLKVLQERSFQRVGGEGDIQTDVRIIAATNTNLKEMVKNQQFREDLFYRLNVFPIEVPLLKDRLEDLNSLINLFLKNLNRHYHKKIYSVSESVIQAFKLYSWPGNIRELENLIERAYIMQKGPSLEIESFPREIFDDLPGDTMALPCRHDLPLALARGHAVDEFEKRYLRELLLKNHGKINQSAIDAGISTRQLHKLLSRHELDRKDYRN